MVVCLGASCAAEPETTPTVSPTTSTSSTTATTGVTTTTTTPATTPSTTASVELPAGYDWVEIVDENVRLALPESWVTVDLTQQDWEELLAEGLASVPKAAELASDEAQVLISEGGLLLAYDFEHRDEEFVTNVNLLSVERGPLDGPEVLSSILSQQLEQIGALDLVIDEVEVPLGPAVWANYLLPPDTGFTHSVVQYYVFGVDTVYIATFSTHYLTELEIVFDTIMSTLEAIEN